MTGNSVQVPPTDAFRAWVRAALPLVGASPTELAAGLGLGRNGVTQFLNETARDVRLGTAQRIEAEIRRRACESGADLPEISIEAIAGRAAEVAQ